MEFDWNPLGKPKPGREKEFLSLFKLLRSLRGLEKGNISRTSLDQKWHKIQVSPYETLQAPRVGSDAVADEWVLAQYRAWKNPTQSESEFLREMHGFYVLALVPPCDGFPFYSNGGIGHIERFSFRAQLLRDCEDVIGRVTMDQCYRSCLASALQGLGEDLQALAMQYCDKLGVTHVESVSRPNFEEGSAEHKAHIVLTAARWCSYWSGRGHGLAANWPSAPT